MTDDIIDPAQAKFLAEVFNPEPLHPDLQPHLYDDGVFGSCLKHPLVFSIMYNPAFNSILNSQYQHKKHALKRATDDLEWYTYVFLHERPYRVDAFMDIEYNLMDSEYWSLLSSIWIDSENIREFPMEWECLLNCGRSGRESMMGDEERKALAALPDIIDIYRGHTDERDDGWSWTTDKAKAEWFAHRFARLEGARPLLTTARVRRDDVYAYLLGRGEYEIITDPDNVGIVGCKSLTEGGGNEQV